MKKIISSLTLLIVLVTSASAFTLREHAAIAIIAQKYLTPEAQVAVNDIFKGETLAMYASYPDQYRKSLIIDGAEVPHMFPVQDDINGDWRMKGDATKNAALAIERSLADLKNYKKLDDKTRLEALAIVVHLVGDIHCPSHLKESKESKKNRVAYYVYAEKKIKFHGAWDGIFAEKTYNGGPLDMAFLSDTATPQQRAEFQKGDPQVWAEESARVCYPITHDLDASEEKNIEVNREYVTDHAYLVKCQVMKAGYRLAQVLNTVFK